MAHWTRGKIITLAGLLAAVATMLVLVSFSVTLYRLFCAATGYAGTTGRAQAVIGAPSDRTVDVAFTTQVAPGMPWRFVPLQDHERVHLGQASMAFFEAENVSDHPVVGHATFNVTPDKVGAYFKKIQCFCFVEERLGPHQKVEMPVLFFVDKRLGSDSSTADVNDITLSYTFFVSKNPAEAADLSRFASAPPDAADGGVLFAEHCAECHAVTPGPSHRAGPSLAGVFGRVSGTLPGYPYSDALAAAHKTWNEATLDAWLRDPQADIPGTAMGLAVPGSQARRDLIAWLRDQHATPAPTAANPVTGSAAPPPGSQSPPAPSRS
jgi:cytochrome c oxidase assembly protein Cox11